MSNTSERPQPNRHLRPTVQRPHWSYSQISQFLRCPLQFYFERVEKLPRTKLPSGMVLGSAIHAGLAEFHRHVKEGKSFSLEQLKSTFTEAMQCEEQTKIDFKEGETKQTLLEQGVNLLETYFKEPPPENIVAVEEPLLVPLVTSRGEVLEKPLVAIIDLLTRTQDGLLIDEFKTSGRKMSESEVDSAMQASCYVHAIREKYDEPATVRYTVLVKTKTPSIQRMKTERTPDDLTRIGDVVQTMERAIENRIFYPVETPLNCSGCPYYRQCREWQGCTVKPQIVQPAWESAHVR